MGASPGIERNRFDRLVIPQNKKVSIEFMFRADKESQVNIRSLFTWPEKKYSGVYQLVMRVAAEDKDRAISAIKGGGFNVLTEYTEDITSYLPEV